MAPRANHSCTSGANCAHSAADSDMTGASRPSAASRISARDRVGGGRSSGTSPRRYAAHHPSSRAVRDHHVRVIHRALPDPAKCSRPRRKWPAAWMRFRAVRRAH
ncbi:hypothetical protein J4032_34410 [Streptomyces formicae]|uniref:Uncharacterized protein n=1 Tax=Streptomyces formicae TaxID=1616117 RepID=A0ABY3X287_9ACTN|nr:hypothetical protein J4032_34410 [Streptomyces formicae]